MDATYVDPDEEADAMAQFMGFSAFGTQGPAKKRKFNPAMDAIVDGEELAKLDKGGKRGQGSGGNDIPLGKARVFGLAKSAMLNEDEIDLDDESLDEEGEQSRSVDQEPDHEVRIDVDDEELGPQYIDTSMPPPEEEARTAQARIDAILANTAAGVSSPEVTKAKKSKKELPARGMAQFMAALQGPPPGPPPVLSGVVQQTSQPTSVPGQHQQSRGDRNPLWYEEYYDPSFNENPWARLEKDVGLQSIGSWLERSERGARVS